MGTWPEGEGETVPAEAILGAPVRVGGLRVATVVDLIADPTLTRIVGAEIVTVAAQTRFLPWAAALTVLGGVEIATALVLLDEPELGWYRGRGIGLATLPPARLAALEVGPGGVVTAPVGGLRRAAVG